MVKVPEGVPKVGKPAKAPEKVEIEVKKLAEDVRYIRDMVMYGGDKFGEQIPGREKDQVAWEKAVVAEGKRRVRAKYGDDATVRTLLLKGLQSGDAETKVAATFVMFEYPDKAQVPLLMDALDYKDMLFATMQTLGKIGPDAKTAVPKLLKIATDASYGEKHQRQAIDTLMLIGDSSALPILKEYQTKIRGTKLEGEFSGKSLAETIGELEKK